MALDRRNTLVISASIMALSTLLLSISNSLASWGTIYGLWKICLGILGCGSFQCSDIKSETDAECWRLMAARVFLTIACILSGISTLLLLLCYYKSEDVTLVLVRLNKWLPSVSFLASVIGVSTGIAFVIDEGDSLGPAAILGIFAVIINLTGAIVATRISVDMNP